MKDVFYIKLGASEMFISRKQEKDPIELLEYTLKCLVQYGKVTISDIREKTIYQFSSGEINGVLRNLRKIGVVTYEGRVWTLNDGLIKAMGLLAFQELLNFVLKRA